MKWTEGQIRKLKSRCRDGVSNTDMALYFGCSVGDIHAKRSLLGITIAKCKGIAPNPEFEKAVAIMAPKRSMTKEVRNAFNGLGNAVLLAMASDWTSIEDARVYASLGEALIDMEVSYNKLIGC